MPTSRTHSAAAQVFLFGAIADIEQNSEGDFRFLPVMLLKVVTGGESGFAFGVLTNLDGGFPCCGFIDRVSFRGTITSRFICGVWSIPE